jgi:hypothetical protein
MDVLLLGVMFLAVGVFSSTRCTYVLYCGISNVLLLYEITAMYVLGTVHVDSYMLSILNYTVCNIK